MSYSFSVTAATAAEAKAAVAAKFDEVVAGQPTHAKDRDAALACANAFVDMLVDPPEGQQFYVNMSGSLGWRGTADGSQAVFTGAGVSVSAGHRTP